jgi:hypothetical protein
LRATSSALLVAAIESPLVWMLDRALQPYLGAVVRLGADMVLAGLVAAVTLALSWKRVVPGDLAALLRQSVEMLAKRPRGDASQRMGAPLSEEAQVAVSEQM